MVGDPSAEQPQKQLPNLNDAAKVEDQSAPIKTATIKEEAAEAEEDAPIAAEIKAEKAALAE